LSRDLVAEIVRRARAAGLRSLAHIESARDFHNAVAAGVDIVMHTPGYYWRPGDTESLYLIDNSDAQLAASRNIAVVTTLVIVERATAKEVLSKAEAVQAENLRRLKQAEVRLAIGTDEAPGRFFDEVRHLAESGVLTNVEVLRMMTQSSPTLIFPHRQIGQLADGFEASFLVLEDDPTKDILAASHIRMEYKQGEAVSSNLYLQKDR
jgi:imidazolonepropionase-like amidohydrolase